MKKWTALLSVLLLVLSLAGCAGDDAASNRYEGSGYATAEAAMEAYVAAMKTGDVNAMIKVFAVETYVENFDFECYVDRTWSWNLNMPVPGSDSTADPINLAKRLDYVTTTIQKQLFALMGWTDVLAEPVLISKDEAYTSAAELYAAYDTAQIAKKAKNIRLIRIESDVQLFENASNEFHQAQLAKQAATYGAEEVAGYIATLECEGETYYLGLTLVRYGNRWYVSGGGGDLLDIPASQGGLGLADGLDMP